MSHALSNPYELTAGGITCKTSPFDNGFFIANSDIENLANSKRFLDALFLLYDAQQSRELGGIKVYGLKQKEKDNG
jgi:hypothetical protein